MSVGSNVDARVVSKLHLPHPVAAAISPPTSQSGTVADSRPDVTSVEEGFPLPRSRVENSGCEPKINRCLDSENFNPTNARRKPNALPSSEQSRGMPSHDFEHHGHVEVLLPMHHERILSRLIGPIRLTMTMCFLGSRKVLSRVILRKTQYWHSSP